MINKYAEINDRILLYNACKGILRVKTAGFFSTVANAGNSVGSFLGNKNAGFMNWFTSDPVQKAITGFTNVGKLTGTGLQVGTQVMGAMNTAKQMGQVNAQAAIEARRAALEQARLDMMEHKINQQRKSLGLDAVATSNAGMQSDDAEEGQSMQQPVQQQPQQQLQ